jgi:hypothetical protein
MKQLPVTRLRLLDLVTALRLNTFDFEWNFGDCTKCGMEVGRRLGHGNTAERKTYGLSFNERHDIFYKGACADYYDGKKITPVMVADRIDTWLKNNPV